jgi:hypothetical protein
VDAERDLVSDQALLLSSVLQTGANLFTGQQANEHVLYIGEALYLSFPDIKSLTLDFTLSDSGVGELDVRTLAWEIWNGEHWAQLTAEDDTDGLRASGSVKFVRLMQVPQYLVDGIASRWLRCRLLTPVSPQTVPARSMVRAGHLPVLARVRASAEIERTNLKPDAASTNGQAVDISKPCYPFGEKPRLGDAFYLCSREAFAHVGAEISINVMLLNPSTGASSSEPSSIAPVRPSSDLVLKWEVWGRSGWEPLGTSTPSGTPSAGLADGTQAFTVAAGTLRCKLPATVPTTFNGVEGHWLRVQIAAGNYGVEARYSADGAGGYKLEPATFTPPVLSAVSLGYAFTAAAKAPDAVLAYNSLEYAALTQPLGAGTAVRPFHGFGAELPTLYASFALSNGKVFPNRTVSLYHAVQLLKYGDKAIPLHPDLSIEHAAAGAQLVHRYTVTNGGSSQMHCSLTTRGGSFASVVVPAQLTLVAGASSEVSVAVTVPTPDALPHDDMADRGVLELRISNDAAIHSAIFETRVGTVAARRRSIRWEYWNGTQWARLAAFDGTERLSRAGAVEFLGPTDLTLARHFGITGYWVRTVFDPGEDATAPRLKALLPNTTSAIQASTVRNEVLGSGDASESQQFRTTRSPVLAGQSLEVRELGPLAAEELVPLRAAHGTSAITAVSNSRANEVWVRWIEVTDLYGSGPRDRHYVLDHITGQVSFGDGVQGRIPPRGVGNVRMAHYQTGGGAVGNRAAGTIAQLKTTVPYIDKVSNPDAAGGGFEAESSQSLIARAPRLLRHGWRAVTREDYEDLARLVSPEVARARCVPLLRLHDDPLGTTRVPGAVSVIIVPQSRASKPLPSAELMARAESFLRSHAAPTTEIAVVGPLYVRVDVAVEVALTQLQGASAVEQAIRAELDAFLHPLSGGRDKSGWDFGREPYLSDLHAVVGTVAGVDHVRSLSITQLEELSGAKASGRFLVYSGQHHIRLAYVGEE